MLIGDFNARMEFVEIPNDVVNVIPRLRIDKMTNDNGKCLRDICGVGNLTILSGVAGKPFITFRNANGTSNIDHIIVSKDYLDRVVTYGRDNVIWEVTRTSHWLFWCRLAVIYDQPNPEIEEKGKIKTKEKNKTRPRR